MATPIATIVAPAAPAVRPKRSTDDRVMGVGLCVLLVFLLVTIGLPLWTLLSKAFETGMAPGSVSTTSPLISTTRR
jgi:hypothetical protein